ncbi:MAG: hypothetical protein M9885_00575 [Burkholderiaceae bacterium]|nr:hypothetical protein [Burkholderiaceae bacterium]
MKRHSRHEQGADAQDDEPRGGVSLMALALFAGVVAGAAIAQSWYRDAHQRRRSSERRERIERWEGEGGALPGSVGTGGAASPRPGA